jgi:hypothetical protein
VPVVATLTDVRRIALWLPEVSERPSYDGAAAWRVKDRLFVWEWPLRKADLAHLGETAPAGTVVGVRVPDETDKEALLARGAPYFTTPHFDGHPIVLVELRHVDKAELEELVVDAWLDRAPKRLAQQYVEARG